jgi:hypothetical protein
MNALDAVRSAYSSSHSAIRETIDAMRDDWLFWQPAPGINHAGFLLWHLVRDEDAVVQGELLDRTQLWERHSWKSRFGLRSERQGTGFTSDDVSALKFELADLRAYAGEVWGETLQALADLPAARLEAPIYGRPMLDHLLEGSVGHNWVHLGEVRALMGLRGWHFKE